MLKLKLGFFKQNALVIEKNKRVEAFANFTRYPIPLVNPKVDKRIVDGLKVLFWKNLKKKALKD